MSTKSEAQRLCKKINSYWLRFGIEAKAEPVPHRTVRGDESRVNWDVRSALVLYVGGGNVVGNNKELRAR